MTFAKELKFHGGKSGKQDIPEGLWTKCPRCATMVLEKELTESLKVCPHCQFHFRIGARERIHLLVEACSFEELDADMLSVDVLKFTGPATYESKLADSQRETGLKDAVITGIGKTGKHRTGLGVLDFSFLGGSMGSVVGEKLTRLIEKCTDKALPLIIISASGGARVYEGLFSLMQMAKTSGALSRHDRANLPYLSVLTDPTMAGVLASFASLGSLIVAEPGAMIGFAGPRVIKETTKAELPPGFQTAEFLLDRGLIDAIIPRKEMKRRLIEYLDFMMAGQKAAAVAG
jgi:acetyl-CoA carboxylase carboxyl transferase subunit beta